MGEGRGRRGEGKRSRLFFFFTRISINPTSLSLSLSLSLSPPSPTPTTPTRSGLSDAKLAKIKQAARALVPSGFSPASAVARQRADLVRISSGGKDLDALLGGGFEAGSLTEIHGSAGLGKSQL